MSCQSAKEPTPGDRFSCDAIETMILPRSRDIGSFEVRRALPSAQRQMVGPFIFFDREINTAFADPKFKARLADLGAAPFPGSPAQFGTFIAEETEKWGKVIKFAGIKPE